MMDLRLKNYMVSGGEIFVNGSRFSMFFPHNCTCKRVLEEKECDYIGKMKGLKNYSLYMFNCPHCKTTFSKKSGSVL